MNSLKKVSLVLSTVLIIIPIAGYSVSNENSKKKTCKQIFAEWTTSDPKVISKRAGVTLTLAKKLVKNGPQLVAPEGCGILIEGSKGKPHCNGKPITKNSCRPN